MIVFFKIIKFIFTALYFGLDEFFLNNKLIYFIHILFKPFRIFSKQNRGERFRLVLEKSGPIFIKFGQILSTRRDLLPKDIADELAKLQDKVAPVKFNEIEKILKAAYKDEVNNIFSNIEINPIASASVAQVHQATLINGKKVAIKILRPNINVKVNSDIKLLYFLANFITKLWADGKRLKLPEVVREFEKHTKTELNLLLEAGNCSHLASNFKDQTKLIVPEVFWDYCHEKVMVMEFMDSIPISDIKSLNKNKINLEKLSELGVEIFFTQVFRDGFFHADMHPGNIQVAKDGRYVALDFGIMGTLNDSDKYYLAKNFVCFFNRDYRGVAQAHLDSKWVPSDTSIDEFENAIRSVCEPIFNKPLKDISFGKLLIRLFQTSRQFNMEIQPQLTMLQKTLLNVEGLGRQLNPELDLWKTARPFLEEWLSEQIGYKKHLKDIKNNLPKYLDLLINLPAKLENLKQSIDLKNSIQEFKVRFTDLQEKQTRYKKYLYFIYILIALQSLLIISFFMSR